MRTCYQRAILANLCASIHVSVAAALPAAVRATTAQTMTVFIAQRTEHRDCAVAQRPM